MDMAQMHWQSATGYWLDTFEPTDYQPGAAISP
jgi:hypothetical protein